MIGSTLLLIRSLIQNGAIPKPATQAMRQITACLLYTSDAADE